MADTIEIIQGTATTIEIAGLQGPQGPAGATGGTGAAGQGVPVGGTTGQVLRKVSGTNYDTEWAAAASGSGSVTSVALAGTGLSISGSPITTSGTITANVSYGTTAGTATQGNDSRIANIAANSITTKQGDNSGGTGGTITMRGGITGNDGAGGNSGSINLQGSDNNSNGAANGGSINLSAGAGDGGNITSVGGGGFGGGSLTMSGGSQGVGGSINTSNAGGAISTSNEGGAINTSGGGGAINTSEGGGAINTSDDGGAINTSGFDGAAGGDILTYAGEQAGGSILTYAGEQAGGSVETYDGGGSINTRGTGSIGLGVSGTRTTLTGTATANRAISLPDAGGTIALTSGTTFTTLSVAPAANTTAFTTTGYSLTGSNAQSLIDLSGTWNTTGVPFALKTDLTVTAAGSNSRYADFQVGGYSQFSAARISSTSNALWLYNANSGTNTNGIGANYERGFLRWSGNIVQVGSEKAGTGTRRTLEFVTDGTARWRVGDGSITAAPSMLALGNSAIFGANDSYNVIIASGASGTWRTGVFSPNGSDTGYLAIGESLHLGLLNNGTSGDVRLVRDAANVLALRNGASTPQAYRIYNTFASTTSFERANFRWASNEFIIDAEAGSGGGTLRGIKIGSATSSLLGFYGATPAAQPAAVADATDAATVITQLNALLSRLRTLGLIAT